MRYDKDYYTFAPLYGAIDYDTCAVCLNKDSKEVERDFKEELFALLPKYNESELPVLCRTIISEKIKGFFMTNLKLDMGKLKDVISSDDNRYVIFEYIPPENIVYNKYEVYIDSEYFISRLDMYRKENYIIRDPDNEGEILDSFSNATNITQLNILGDLF